MEETLRLSKLMAQKGLASRREADRFIEKGWVLVDGKCINELGTKVSINAHVELKPQADKEQKRKLTILLNKPIGYVSCQPEKNYKAAIELITEKRRDARFKTKKNLPSYLPKIAVAGRLDINSKGLLILTQDGRLAKKLIEKDSSVEKEYLVRVDRSPTEQEIKKLEFGLKLDNAILKPTEVKRLEERVLRMTLKEGKKRQIRRMCALLNLEVLSIKRVRVGKIKLGSLKEGQWRFLESNEEF